MLKTVFQKTVYERRWALLAWAIGIFAMTLLTMSFYPFFKNSGFDQVIANAPKSLQGLLGQAADYKSVAGYVDQQIFALRMPLFMIIMSIIIFIGVGVGDEDRGTLETLLAQPVSRSHVFLQKFAAAATLTGLACIAIVLGVVASFPIIHGSMNVLHLIAAAFGCWLISLIFGTLTYTVGMATGKRGLTIGVSSGLAFVTYLISSMAPAVDKLSVAQKFTPFYYYNVPTIAQHGLKLHNLAVLLASILIMLAISVLMFRNRDLVRD